MTCVLLEMGSLDTGIPGRMCVPWGGEGRDRVDASTSHQTPKIASKPQKLREKYRRDSPS